MWPSIIIFSLAKLTKKKMASGIVLKIYTRNWCPIFTQRVCSWWPDIHSAHTVIISQSCAVVNLSQLYSESWMDHSTASLSTPCTKYKLKHYVDRLPHTDFHVLYFHTECKECLLHKNTIRKRTFLSLCVSNTNGNTHRKYKQHHI